MAGVTLAMVGLGLMLQGIWDLSFTSVCIGVVTATLCAAMIAPKRPNTAKLWFVPPLVMIPVVMFALWYVMTMAFGHFGVGPILFHMEYGTSANGVVSAFFKQWVAEILYATTLIVGVWIVSAVDHRFRRLDRAVIVPALIVNPISLATLEYVGDAQAASEQLLYNRYIDTADLAPVEGNRPNVLQIFLESSERTLMDESAFGDVMAPLVPFAARGLELTNLHEAALTNWTLAGQIAAHCGVPLMPVGLVNRNNFHITGGNFMDQATCLGDLLSRDGYETAFMKAAPLSFAGVDKYAATHGWERRLGFVELKHVVDAGVIEWGMNDEDLYDALYDQIVDLEAGDRPYALAATNIGGHAPRGYVSPKCRTRASVMQYNNPMLQAFRCTHELTAELIARLEADGFLKNTIVILQSDHLAMRNSIYSDLKARERRNLFIAYGPGIEPQTIERDLSMMDIYPTLLDMLGYAPSGGRAGIGVSAFARSETLIKERGLGALDKAIYGDSALRNRLWGIEAGS